MPLGPSIPITHRTLSPMPNKQSSLKNAVRSAERSFQNLSGLFTGKVLRVDAANNCCDIELITGGILHEVIILQNGAGTIDGVYGVPKIRPPKSKKKKEDEKSQTADQAGTSFASSDKALAQQKAETTQTGGNVDPNKPKSEEEEDDDDPESPDGRIPWKDIEDADYAKPENKRDTWAICGYLLNSANTPVVLGFFFPHSTQMSIKDDQKKKVDRIDYLRRLPGRHYEVNLRGGTYEHTFPDGSHFRIGHPKEPDATDQQQEEPKTDQNPNLPPSGAGVLAVTAPVDTPGLPTDPSNQGLQQPPAEDADDFYDDADDDPDGRIKLGHGQYENLDKKDKPWKIKKDPKRRRMFMVHSTKAKLGICEHGVSHIQNYIDVAQESSPPEGYTDLDGGASRQQKISTGDLDAHQRRMWRARWGDQSTPPGEEAKLIVGEHWFDPQEKRDRYWIRVPSDGGGQGSLNDPSWQNAPNVSAPGDGTGNIGEDGQGDPNGDPANRGQAGDPAGTGSNPQASGVQLNSHGVFADSFVGSTKGTSKWAAGSFGIDAFGHTGDQWRAPGNGTVTYQDTPSASPLDPGGQQHTAYFTFSSGPHAGTQLRVTHIQGGHGPSSVQAGDTIARMGDPGLGGGGSNWQHWDISVSTNGSYQGNPPMGGSEPAGAWLDANGFNISTFPGQTNGPDQLLQGGDPFGGRLGGTSPGSGGFGNGNDFGGGANAAQQEAKRKWYMPAAVPAGGGVQGVVQPIGEKCLDSKAAENGGRGMVDAAAADHVHGIKAAGDDDMQPAGESGSGGDMSSGFALGNHVHPTGGGMLMLSMDMHQSLLDKIQALEQRVALMESR